MLMIIRSSSGSSSVDQEGDPDHVENSPVFAELCAQNNMADVGSRARRWSPRGRAPRPAALLPPSGLTRQPRSPKGLGHRIAASGPGIASACESAWGPGSSQFCSFHVEAGRRQDFLRLGPFDFLLNIRWAATNTNRDFRAARARLGLAVPASAPAASSSSCG
jgi:hypothetical protein